MGISYSEVVANGLLSDEVIEYIPSVCETCGTEIHFTDSLKQIYCPNRFCPDKIAARLEYMAKLMKADGWGASTCREVCRIFKLKSPYQVFLLEGPQYMALGKQAIPAFEKKIASICDRNKRRVRLWEVVKLAGIPSIENIAYKIFNGYKSLKKAYEDIERYQVAFIADKLGLRNNETSVMAVNIYNTLIEYKNELLFGETQFEVYIPEGDELQIAITGGVDGFPNKSEFITYLNRRYAGKINAMLVNSVTAKTNILVSDKDLNSNKYKTACKLRERGYDIKIMSSRELIRYLDEKYGR